MEKTSKEKRSLDECLNVHSELARIVREIADEMDLCIEQGGNRDEAEKRIVPLVRKLGAEALAARARSIATELPAPAGMQVRRHSKKSPLADEFWVD